MRGETTVSPRKTVNMATVRVRYALIFTGNSSEGSALARVGSSFT
jgi:hypothetical protein